MAVKRASKAPKAPTPEAQLRALVARFAPKVQKDFRAVRSALRKRFPAANELAYDYGTHVVISYSPSENGIEGILATATRPSGVSLYFNQGPKLRDPNGVLRGKGKSTRFVELRSAADLKDPEIAAFIAATVAQAGVPFLTQGKGTLIIKATAASKRAGR